MAKFRLGARSAALGSAPCRAIGLDAGERRTKVVVVEGTSADPRVVAWSDEPTPPGLIVSGRPARPELAVWLRRSLAQGRAGDPVWVAAPWTDAQVKRLSVPDPASRETTLRGLAVNPAFRAVGGEVAASRLDYHVIDAASGAVMAVAVRPDAVRALALSAAAAGAELTGASVTESAIAHAWLATAEEPAGRAVLLEGGYAGVTLVVMDAGQPVGFRRVMFGARALEERGGGPPAGPPPPLVEEWSGRIAQEVRMLAGAAFRGTGSGIPPVVVMGGLGKSQELVDGLRRALGGVVERWGVGVVEGEERGEAPGEGTCGIAVAFGLAVQGLAQAEGRGAGPGIQLLRPADAVEARGEGAGASALARDRGVRAALAGCALVAVACGAGEWWMGRASAAEGRALMEARVDSARVQGDISRVARLQAERARLGGAMEAAERLRGESQLWPRLMDRLSRAMPANAWADSLAMVPQGPGEGGARFRATGYAGTAGQVAALERSLRGGPVAETAVVSLAPVPVLGLTLVRWTLVGRLSGPGMLLSPDAGYGWEETLAPGVPR
jgi:hypothetical protein